MVDAEERIEDGPESITGVVERMAPARFASKDDVERERRERRAAEQYQITRERIAPLRARLPAKDYGLLLDEGLDLIAPLNAVQTWLVKTPLPFFVLGGVVGCGNTLAGAWAIAEHGGVLVDAVNLVVRVAPWFHEKRNAETIEIERA